MTKETHQTPDTNGWIEVRDNPLSKVGVFEYSGELIAACLPGVPGIDPSMRYAVLRPAEELSRPETLDSARLLPWIDDHPPVLLGKTEEGKVLPENKGIGGVTGEDITFRDGVLYGNIKFLTVALAERYRQGKKELSMGYACDYVPESGEYEGQPYQFKQVNIRFNHLALVENGRMGKDVAVLDSIDKETLNMNDEERVKMLEQAIAALTGLVHSYKAAPAAPAEAPPAAPAKDAAPAPGEKKAPAENTPAQNPSDDLVGAAKAVIDAAAPEAPPAVEKEPSAQDVEEGKTETADTSGEKEGEAPKAT